ncbi:hypothetical protein SUGI_0044770 [Cryptomeria japonica]|uniref:cytochrome c oxidase assembly protein COX11, mitochondrial n=1 Tax=Cryptomeria japonica TaxID=3369 RepID=UPI002408CC91|nr:cytochrome c oxidase assembly protein COX11, mitochondrial [Cryptomeria japonica]GLJ06675.1 hypothetical protein SUGI_0044770 [Cryptomeria japonica]
MLGLKGHQYYATSLVKGVAGMLKNLHELQKGNEHYLMRLQTMKLYTYHQTGKFAMITPTRVPEGTHKYPLMLGSVLKFKESLYESSNYRTSFRMRQSWNSCKVAGFSTQRSDTIKGSQKLSAGQAGSNKSQATLLYLLALVVAMVGSTYAAVPLYRKFCQATGYGGTIQRRETVEEKIARHVEGGTKTSRELVIQFNADVADGMPWKFIPSQREVRVKPGESALAFYTAENFSPKAITGVSTYNITPMKAAVYFNKIQCFCFEEQRLLPGEKIDMPVFFYVDPEFESDPKMNGINNMILSYTFFKVEDEEV